MIIELKEEVYDLFEGFYIFEINEIISNLPENKLQQIIKYLGINSTNTNSCTARKIVAFLKKELNKKYKKNIYKKYSLIDRNILDKVINSLTLEELDLLKKEYTLEDRIELKEPITNKEQKRLYKIMKKIDLKLKTLLNVEIKNKKDYKSFFTLFPGYTKEEILLVVHHLEIKDYKLLTKKYGKNLTNIKNVPSLTIEENNDINTRILLNIRRRLKRIRNGANYYTISALINVDKELIKERMPLLDEKIQKRLYDIFGKNLDKEILINIKHISTIISKSAIKKLTFGKIKRSVSKIVPFYQRLIMFKKENESMEDFKKRINSCIESKYLATLTKKYGPDLMADTNNGLYTDEDTREINVLIIPMIKYKLQRLENTKTIMDYFAPFVTLEDFYEGLNELNTEELNRLMNEFGPNFDRKRSSLDYTKGENIKTTKTIYKLESIIYKIIASRIKINKREIKSSKILRNIKSLINSNEFKYISSIYSPNEALAIMIKLNIDINNESISLLTGVLESKITELTIDYLEEQSWQIKNNCKRLIKTN